MGYYSRQPVKSLICDTVFEKYKKIRVVDDELEPLLYRFVKMKSFAVFYHHCPFLSAGTSFVAGSSPGADGAGGLIVKDFNGGAPMHLKLAKYEEQWYIVKAI